MFCFVLFCWVLSYDLPVKRAGGSRERGVGTLRPLSKSFAAETPPSCDLGVLGPAERRARLGSLSGSPLAHAAGRPYQADQPPVDGDQPTDGASCLLIVAVQSTARRCSSPLQLLASAAGSRWASPRCLSSGWWPSAVRRRGGLYLALPAALETAERRAQETCP